MQKPKKKIAFVLTSFVVGGVEKSFLDLLDCIDMDAYDVTVFLPDDVGAWTPKLKEKCTVKYLKIEDFKTVLISQISRLDFWGAFRSLFFRILARAFSRSNYRKSTEFFIRSMTREREKFNCAAAYQIINDDCVLGTLFRVKADRKVVWSHAFINKQEKIYGQWYGKFDQLFCVSDFARKALIDNFPELVYKTEVFHNALNPAEIKRLSEEPPEPVFQNASGTTVIVTVGRLSREKGQMMVPKTVRILLESGHPVTWYLVGDGELRAEIICEISKNHVEEHVILLGNKDNPFPYMRTADIYVQTSFVEGWGLTVSEAKILKKPIVTTNAGVMDEQIRTGVNGLIVNEASPEALSEGISQLLDHPEMGKRFVQHLGHEEMYIGEIEKLYRVMDK